METGYPIFMETGYITLDFVTNNTLEKGVK